MLPHNIQNRIKWRGSVDMRKWTQFQVFLVEPIPKKTYARCNMQEKDAWDDLHYNYNAVASVKTMKNHRWMIVAKQMCVNPPVHQHRTVLVSLHRRDRCLPPKKSGVFQARMKARPPDVSLPHFITCMLPPNASCVKKKKKEHYASPRYPTMQHHDYQKHLCCTPQNNGGL